MLVNKSASRLAQIWTTVLLSFQSYHNVVNEHELQLLLSPLLRSFSAVLPLRPTCVISSCQRCHRLSDFLCPAITKIDAGGSLATLSWAVSILPKCPKRCHTLELEKMGKMGDRPRRVGQPLLSFFSFLSSSSFGYDSDEISRLKFLAEYADVFEQQSCHSRLCVYVKIMARRQLGSHPTTSPSSLLTGTQYQVCFKGWDGAGTGSLEDQS